MNSVITTIKYCLDCCRDPKGKNAPEVASGEARAKEKNADLEIKQEALLQRDAEHKETDEVANSPQQLPPTPEAFQEDFKARVFPISLKDQDDLESALLNLIEEVERPDFRNCFYIIIKKELGDCLQAIDSKPEHVDVILRFLSMCFMNYQDMLFDPEHTFLSFWFVMRLEAIKAFGKPQYVECTGASLESQNGEINDVKIDHFYRLQVGNKELIFFNQK